MNVQLNSYRNASMSRTSENVHDAKKRSRNLCAAQLKPNANKLNAAQNKALLLPEHLVGVFFAPQIKTRTLWRHTINTFDVINMQFFIDVFDGLFCVLPIFCCCVMFPLTFQFVHIAQFSSSCIPVFCVRIAASRQSNYTPTSLLSIGFVIHM